MSTTPTVPVSRRNPHWEKGESDAAHARRRGWSVGTRLVGDEGYGPTTITITALGQATVVARADGRDRENTWTLAARDWVELPGLPEEDSDWASFDMTVIEHVAAGHGLTAEQLMRAAQVLHRYEESLSGPGGQVVQAMSARHVHAALRVLSTLGLPPRKLGDVRPTR